MTLPDISEVFGVTTQTILHWIEGFVAIWAAAAILVTIVVVARRAFRYLATAIGLGIGLRQAKLFLRDLRLAIKLMHQEEALIVFIGREVFKALGLIALLFVARALSPAFAFSALVTTAIGIYAMYVTGSAAYTLRLIQNPLPQIDSFITALQRRFDSGNHHLSAEQAALYQDIVRDFQELRQMAAEFKRVGPVDSAGNQTGLNSNKT